MLQLWFGFTLHRVCHPPQAAKVENASSSIPINRDDAPGVLIARAIETDTRDSREQPTWQSSRPANYGGAVSSRYMPPYGPFP